MEKVINNVCPDLFRYEITVYRCLRHRPTYSHIDADCATPISIANHIKRIVPCFCHLMTSDPLLNRQIDEEQRRLHHNSKPTVDNTICHTHILLNSWSECPYS